MKRAAFARAINKLIIFFFVIYLIYLVFSCFFLFCTAKKAENRFQLFHVIDLRAFWPLFWLADRFSPFKENVKTIKHMRNVFTSFRCNNNNRCCQIKVVYLNTENEKEKRSLYIESMTNRNEMKAKTLEMCSYHANSDEQKKRKPKKYYFLWCSALGTFVPFIFIDFFEASMNGIKITEHCGALLAFSTVFFYSFFKCKIENIFSLKFSKICFCLVRASDHVILSHVRVNVWIRTFIASKRCAHRPVVLPDNLFRRETTNNGL